MYSFIQSYFNIYSDKEEVAVLCPFPHKLSGGTEFLETNPSAFINTSENLFHCQSCKRGFNEIQFIKEVLGCNAIVAKKISTAFQHAEQDITTWNKHYEITEDTRKKLHEFKITDEIIEQLRIRTTMGTQAGISFPVFINDILIDECRYRPNQTPKMLRSKGAPSGTIIPYDIWKNTNTDKVTIICAGEKDMAVTRSHGFNAITITGGEGTLPFDLKSFSNRQVIICYDNDRAGKTGAYELGKKLKEYTNEVFICTGFHEICKEEKEDLTDFFVKYNKSKQDLIKYLDKATPIEITEETAIKEYKQMTLAEASLPENLNKIVKSNIQVISSEEHTFNAESYITGEKMKPGTDSDCMLVGEIREWKLNDFNAQEILHLIDGNFKQTLITENQKNLLKIPRRELNVKIHTEETQAVFKSTVTDLLETKNKSVNPMEYTAYSIGTKLESGQKYNITYKLVPHPYKGRKLTMIVLNAEDSNDSVNSFKITPDVISNLKQIQDLSNNVEESINTQAEMIKSFLGYNGNNQLISLIDLSFNTVLEFDFGTLKNIRGYLDTFIVGESRVGKSSTVDALRNIYGLGTFTSLAGNSATIPGLVGGSHPTANGMQIRAGLIPQNHKGLIIFEEFGKSDKNIIQELTDIRSSNEVRVARVSGSINLPAMVRMITLTNPKVKDEHIKPIAAYPNGIAVMTDLITTAEDIARYDLILILSDRGNSEIDPLWEPKKPFDEQVYKDRIRWIWTRTKDQIKMTRDIEKYIVDESNKLNKLYASHIKIFGTETWKKLTRLAIAVAGYTISTDENYENIIIKKEHIDYASNLLASLYDNHTFKLKEYVKNERKYTQIDEDGIKMLEDIYTKYPSLVLQLEACSSTSQKILSSSTGLTNEDLGIGLNKLTRGLFIQFSKNDIIPTERFRKGLESLNKDLVVSELGE